MRGRKAVVVLLVDLLDASGTLMPKVRDMVGGNPIVLVGTKLDLLPAGAEPKAVAQWLHDAAAARRLNVTSVHLVSSHTGEGAPACPLAPLPSLSCAPCLAPCPFTRAAPFAA